MAIACKSLPKQKLAVSDGPGCPYSTSGPAPSEKIRANVCGYDLHVGLWHHAHPWPASPRDPGDWILRARRRRAHAIARSTVAKPRNHQLGLALINRRQIAGRGAAGCSVFLVWRMRASMSALAVTPVMPRVISRGSDSCRPKISQQASSPRISIQVPDEID